MKAIETTYKGYRFRSRLEARWAVFFDAMGIKWEYEKEGFEKQENYGDGDPHIVRYLPDFYLPQTETWVEVKASPEALASDYQRLGDILDYGSPLDHFTDSYGERTYGKVHGLLLLYDIPYGPNGVVFHPLLQHYKGIRVSRARFIGYGLQLVSEEYLAGVRDAVDTYGTLLPKEDWLDGLSSSESDWKSACAQVQVNLKWHYEKVNKAYEAARSARFEHGESPRV